jgi:hypothetical protein
MKTDAVTRWAAVLGVLAGISAIAMGFYIHSAQPKLGPSWDIVGILVTSPRLLLGIGIIMVVGGVLTLWSPAGGGLIVLVCAVVGLIYTYTHEWHRIDLLWVWALPVLLGWVAGIMAGYALGRSVDAYDGPANGTSEASGSAPQPPA